RSGLDRGFPLLRTPGNRTGLVFPGLTVFRYRLPSSLRRNPQRCFWILSLSREEVSFCRLLFNRWRCHPGPRSTRLPSQSVVDTKASGELGSLIGLSSDEFRTTGIL